jgi:hypothetical protein
MNAPSPIQALIENRCRDLALTAPDLIHRADYKNIAKGLRRLEALMTDDLVSSRGLIAKLPLALQLPPETITEAVEEARRQIREREEQVYRESFKPHGVIVTEREIPSQIFIAGLVRADRNLRIDFDLSKDRSTFVHQALNETRLRLHRFNGVIPFFGRAIGLVVNFAPERAVRCDLEGVAVEILKGAYRTGKGYVQIGRRRVQSTAFGSMSGSANGQP